ncbi:MAG: AAA family ATPase, partial [Rectinemataceae bacterium]
LLCEIKSSATFHPDFLEGMNYVEALLAQPVKKRLIMGTLDEPYWFKDTQVLGYSMTGDVQ